MEKPFTRLEEAVWHCILHDNYKPGERILMHKRSYNYLKEYCDHREDIKPSDHKDVDVNFIKKMTYAFLKPGVEIPNFCEIFDKAQFDLEWDFNEPCAFYWPLKHTWHDSFDIGDDIPYTPEDALAVDHAIHKNDRKITTGFIADARIAGASKEILKFLEDHKGKYAVLIN